MKDKKYNFGNLDDIYVPNGSELNSPAQYLAKHSETAFLTSRFLKDLNERDVGWFAHLTYVKPHPPFVAPAPYNSLLDPNIMPIPFYFDPSYKEHSFDSLSRQYKRSEDMVNGFDELDKSLQTTQKIRAIYMGLVAELDNHIGRIFSWLKEAGQYDETLIIITSDHGEMLGDYGCWGKMHYFDGAFHVPLMIKPPKSFNGDFGTTIDAPSESIDVTPTILDLMGIEIPSGQGNTIFSSGFNAYEKLPDEPSEEKIIKKKKKTKKLKSDVNELLKNVSIPKGLELESIDLEKAQFLCSLPKSLGLNPDNQKEITLNTGRFGPYLKCENKSARIENIEEIFSIGLNRAITLIAEAKPGRMSSSIIKDLGEHPEDKKPVRVMKGQYGPYIKYKSLNATIPEEKDPTDLTMEEALILIEKRKEYDKNKKTKIKKKSK